MAKTQETYPPAGCSVPDCVYPWRTWHRKCNLVYCAVHAEQHRCQGTPGDALGSPLWPLCNGLAGRGKGARPPVMGKPLDGGRALERGGCHKTNGTHLRMEGNIT